LPIRKVSSHLRSWLFSFPASNLRSPFV
jgi:hypothetical protein